METLFNWQHTRTQIHSSIDHSVVWLRHNANCWHIYLLSHFNKIYLFVCWVLTFIEILLLSFKFHCWKWWLFVAENILKIWRMFEFEMKNVFRISCHAVQYAARVITSTCKWVNCLQCIHFSEKELYNILLVVAGPNDKRFVIWFWMILTMFERSDSKFDVLRWKWKKNCTLTSVISLFVPWVVL